MAVVSTFPTITSRKGLEPAWESAAFTWDESSVRHLYRRACFAPTFSEISAGLALNPSSAVHTLLNAASTAVPPSWVNDLPFPTPLTSEQQQQYNTWKRELREWQIRVMLTEPTSLREKMVLFWHGHFATQVSDVKVPQHMYHQNALFRQFAFGNFKEMVKAVAIDPAMLIYLDGIKNRVGNPNENFARELLELFTIGVDNYTQADIQEASRAFTGWQVNGLDAVFNSSRHDYGQKTFMGHTGNFDGNAIIDIIFDQPETARFICRKLYKFFVYEMPSETVVNQLAVTLRNSNYKISAVLDRLFKSAHFYDTLHVGAGITSPVDRTAGVIRQLEITVDPGSNVVPKFVRTETPEMGQELFEPPNVAGWPGYRQWISTTSLALRNAFTDAVVDGVDANNSNIGFSVNPIGFAQEFPDPNDPVALVSDICKHLCPLPVAPIRQEFLLETLLQGIEPENWSLAYPGAAQRIKDLLKVVMRLAEYQLG